LPQDIDESVIPGESPAAYVRRLAIAKVNAACSDPELQARLPVLAADTSVVIKGRILGKPASAEEALEMLMALSGTSHQVLTAIAVGRLDQGGVVEAEVVTTKVSFRDISEAEIQAYWLSGEPCDKAGAYGIQGRAALFASRIEGSYTNVVGLPLFETMQLLGRHGINTTSVLRGTPHEC